MARPVIIVGAGGHAKVLIAILLLLHRDIIGVMEANREKQRGFLSKIPIIGDDEAIKNYKPEEIELVNGVGSVGFPQRRMEIYQRLKNEGYTFAGVVHPSAMLTSDIQLGEGVQIMAGAIIQPGCCIGDNAIINTGAILDHDCIIGEHTHIAPGAVLSGGVHIGVMSHVGTAATVIQGITIGENTVIGAGAVVIRNIPAGNKAVGVPARNIEN